MLCSLNSYSHTKDEEEEKVLLFQGFANPADSMQTSVYWYWISDNISKEGVINDLKSMKKVGINRAFIGNIGLDAVPYGKVKMFSDEWWEILHTALKTATDLGIDIGIFNSPGWSQSGGPWVKPENAMRYLTSTQTKVVGPRRFSQKLPKANDIFQDVKVIAFPAPLQGQYTLSNANSSISVTPQISGISRLFDGNLDTEVKFPEVETITIDLESKGDFTARSLTINTTEYEICADVLLQVKKSNGSFETIKSFELNRANSSLNVGFKPFAPIVVSFEATTAKYFRVIIKSKTPTNWNFPNVNTQDGLKEISLSALPRVDSYAEKTLAKMYPTPLPYWEEYQWPVQKEVEDKNLLVEPSSVIDVTKFMMVDGTLNWEVPEGEWVIMRFGMTPTGTMNGPASPESIGYEVDKLSKKHAEKHFYAFMGEVLKRIPAKDRKSFKVVVQDSYETGGQNFTDDFLEEFEEVYAYDPIPFLPVYEGIVVKSQMASDRFLWDMRRLVADKVAYDYVAGLRDVSHRHGLTTWLENYGHWGFPGEFLMYGGQSDEIAGEFWSEGSLGDIENRAATSCGHIYGKTKISAESNTCGGHAFSRYPATLKQRGDKFFAEGINNTLLHVYISQAYADRIPGVNAPFGNEFNRNNTWFSQIDVYIDYLKRCNYMLQQGLNVADVAYFIGEDAPKMTGVTDPPLPVGYEFDYMNAEVILKYMTVKDGLITLPHGTQYRMLVLPKLETMRPELLKKISELVHQGAVILGPPPHRSPSLHNQPLADQQVKELADQLWEGIDGIFCKSRNFGKGIVINGMNMDEALRFINCIPDCRLPDDNSIHFGHRTLGFGDVYFLSNQTDSKQSIEPEFRVTGMQPELWLATDGTQRELPEFTQTKSTTKVPLQLAPYESVFIVFKKTAKMEKQAECEKNFPLPKRVSMLNGPWKVQFNESQRGPRETIIFDQLQDWSKSKDDRIKYYSGTAIYSQVFQLDKLSSDTEMYIDLGRVMSMAKVKINGNYVGGVWTAPYQLCIDKWVKEGENTVEIEVVNTWVNRLIGDLQLPIRERKTRLSINPYNSTSPLQVSGLIGPVKIVEIER